MNYDSVQVTLSDYNDWAGLRYGFAATPPAFKKRSQVVADCDNPAPVR